MARLMSVAFTEDAVRERRKTVTRRAGWWETRDGRRILHHGDHLILCRKVMGRRKGEPLVRIAAVSVWDVRREPLDALWTGNTDYGAREMVAEGFPGLDPREFVRRYFTDAQGITPDEEVTRVEWRYLCSGRDPAFPGQVCELPDRHDGPCFNALPVL